MAFEEQTHGSKFTHAQLNLLRMPVLWQASQRPMFVHTVWVDGLRHAILTNDDPYIAKLKEQRPRSSASATQYAGYSGKIFYNLRQESRRLNRIIENDKYSVDQLNLNELDQESERSYVLKAASQQLYNYDSNRSSYNSHGLNMKAFRNIRKTRSEKPERDVSTRVSQWLDLAGKTDSSAVEKVTKIVQSRYSWPAMQRPNLSNSKTEVDLKVEEETKAPNDFTWKETVIDQRDFPPFVNTVQNYARESRYKIATRDSRKKTAKRDVQGNVLKARQKVAAVRSPAEAQCAGLFSVKEIVPDQREAKKQVNIVLPGAIKTTKSMTKRLEKLLSDLS